MGGKGGWDARIFFGGMFVVKCDGFDDEIGFILKDFQVDYEDDDEA